jgi:hypothetical protein
MKLQPATQFLGALLMLLPIAAFGQLCTVPVTAHGVTVGRDQPSAVRTANTTALNTMFTGIASGSIPCHNVQFPEGTIEINGPVSISIGPITIAGVNRELSVIMQTSPTAPAFLWDSNNAYVTGIYVHDLGFDNANTTAPYNGVQWGLQFQCTAGAKGGNSWGYANSQFERLSISHMNVGLGEFTTGGGVCPIWSTHFQDIKFYNMQSHAIYLVSSGAVGQPANQFDRIDILQENSPPATTGDAIFIQAPSGLVMNSIDIEGWDNEEIQIEGGNSVIINDLRVEHAVFNGCNPSIGFFDGDVILNSTSISWDSFSNSCMANVFSIAGASTSLFVNGVTLTANTAAPSAGLTLWRADNPNPPGKIIANNLTLNGLASEYLPSTAVLTTTLYSRYSIDTLPPPVDTLPPASATYMGRSFMVAAGTTGHIIYRCIQNAGTYQWVAQ